MTCRKNYWATCFQQVMTYMYKKKRKKYLRSSHIDGKCEIPVFTKKRQKANAKNGGKIVVTWSFLSFAFHVYTMQNLSTRPTPPTPPPGICQFSAPGE